MPDYALDKHTRRGREMGRGIPHFYSEGAVVSPVAPVDDPYLERAIEIDEQAERRRRQGSSGIIGYRDLAKLVVAIERDLSRPTIATAAKETVTLIRD